MVGDARLCVSECLALPFPGNPGSPDMPEISKITVTINTIIGTGGMYPSGFILPEPNKDDADKEEKDYSCK